MVYDLNLLLSKIHSCLYKDKDVNNHNVLQISDEHNFSLTYTLCSSKANAFVYEAIPSNENIIEIIKAKIRNHIIISRVIIVPSITTHSLNKTRINLT